MNKRTPFIKQWLPTILTIAIIILLVAGWTYLWYVIGYHNSTVDLTKQLTEEYDQKLQAYIDELNTVPVVEEDELTKQVNELTDYLDELIAGYSMNSNINLEGEYAIGWCFIARYETKGEFGNTAEEILNKPNQWQWYSPDNPVRDQDTAIAREIAASYYNRHYPNNFTTNLCFAELKADGSVVLRNKLPTAGDDSIQYWKYKMG